MESSNSFSKPNLIPKIIHFVWVGSAPKPQLVTRCMASWATHCSGYNLIEWGNSQLSEIDNTYVKEAAAAGKWAFVSDYMRLNALYKHGGFYFDSDLEVTAPIDQFRHYGFVTGFEKTLDGKRVRPVTALMAATPGNPIIERLLSEYEHLHFLNNGIPDLTTNTDRIKKHFRKHFGLKKSVYKNGEKTMYLDKSSVIFPYYFFCTPKPGAENYAIHHFNGSWVPPGRRKTICVIGKWQLLKFSFKRCESLCLSISGDEKLILKILLPGKKKRVLAIVRRHTKTNRS